METFMLTTNLLGGVKKTMKTLFCILLFAAGCAVGANKVPYEQYEFLLQFLAITVPIGLCTGIVVVVGKSIHLDTKEKRLLAREDDLNAAKGRLWEERAQFEQEQHVRVRRISESVNHDGLERIEEEKKTALGRQLEQVKGALHSDYKALLEQLRDENQRLKRMIKTLKGQLDEAQKKTTFRRGASNAPKVTEGSRLVPGPPIDRKQ